MPRRCARAAARLPWSVTIVCKDTPPWLVFSSPRSDTITIRGPGHVNRTLSLDSMRTTKQRSASDTRRHPRHPIRLPARVIHAGVENPGCVIEDFCRTGMAVSMPASAATPQLEVDAIRGYEPIMVAFRLPGEGRQVRARALLKHLRREGTAVRMGLFFEQSHPAIMESLLNESLHRHGRSGSGRAVGGGEPPAPAARPPGNDSDPLSAADEPPIDHLVPELCETFFRQATDRLLERYKSDTKDPEVFFRGLVAVHSLQGQLEARLRVCNTPTVGGIRAWFARILRELEVNGAVEDELHGILDETLSVVKPRD